ncbi:MAG: hypothetical protein A3C84_03050 [Candidatus Ryanbacteria bacterium RIFCSPHIGHO2_02_FULL_48_12]|uniref:Uncharacterized protein n=1 Tax=Candidatus Ryanbacteria bacterium RIFCSPHIGHO2_01_FULL_48_27 TaxID=1802115 RepID=A0A1G2G5V3_9BACT|nr:MAG: hypothetical protein A2756_01520 [Candidatus Ryanbacteria bacterium RIFCSPHIGHO2_01_FULL_48_27]OGZ49078.1 MAG: hypothetical protein A3C84_03050 [Candidatus Ryanbacteria bacterium RIFCSPHIGHO2_02_FULL_48_12]
MSNVREFVSFLALKTFLLVLVPWMATVAPTYPWWVVALFAVSIWVLPVLNEYACCFLDGGDYDGPSGKAIYAAHLIPLSLLVALVVLKHISLATTIVLLVLELLVYCYRDSFSDRPVTLKFGMYCHLRACRDAHRREDLTHPWTHRIVGGYYALGFSSGGRMFCGFMQALFCIAPCARAVSYLWRG